MMTRDRLFWNSHANAVYDSKYNFVCFWEICFKLALWKCWSLFQAMFLPEFQNRKHKEGTNASTVKIACVVSYPDTAVKRVNSISAWLSCNKAVPALGRGGGKNWNNVPHQVTFR